MKKTLIILLMIVCAGVSIAAPTEEIISVTSPEASVASKINLIKSVYYKALMRENMDTLENSLYAYNSVLAIADKMLNSSNVDNRTASLVFPFYIASAYRKGIITNRYVEGSVIELYRQIKLFSDADKWIQQVLTTASNYNSEKRLQISSQSLGVLYFARAYNRTGWAFAMLNGSLWKRYVIYPPSETVKMMERSMEDLKKMMVSYGVPFEKGKYFYSSDDISSYIDQLNGNSVEFKTFSLCFSYSDKNSIAKMLARLIEENSEKTLEMFYSQEIRLSFQKGRAAYSFEDLLKPETKEFAGAISKLLAEMEVK
ncbi:MAG: hypothetical protein NTZ10_04935 [Candidatus Saganbacteria bacterium]|nr:hypothetical protein [Candidatus Saganbacteria bacterium]